jgi:hypothetical protein
MIRQLVYMDMSEPTFESTRRHLRRTGRYTLLASLLMLAAGLGAMQVNLTDPTTAPPMLPLCLLVPGLGAVALCWWLRRIRE